MQDIIRVLTTVGFFSISNVPDFDEDELLRAVTAFYKEVPNEERQKLLKRCFRAESPNFIRGLTPFFDNYPSHKEMYDMGSSLKFVSDEALTKLLYEDTPFPP